MKLLLDKAWNEGYTELMISCRENNAASTRVIEKNGGIFNRINENSLDGLEKEYWIFKPR